MSDDKLCKDWIKIGSYHKRSDIVKIKFSSSYIYKNTNIENMRIQISLGSCIARQLKWKDRDLINIYQSNNCFFLNKIDNTQENDPEYKIFKGYTLRKVSNSYFYSVIFTVTCNFFNELKNKKISFIPYEIITIDNNSFLKVFLDNLEKDNKINKKKIKSNIKLSYDEDNK